MTLALILAISVGIGFAIPRWWALLPLSAGCVGAVAMSMSEHGLTCRRRGDAFRQSEVRRLQARYQTLNKIYGAYFSPGRAFTACMAVECIPGDSLIEVVGSARVVTSPPAAA